MVQLNSTFTSPSFVKWRKGYGFGKCDRDYMGDPSVVRTGRCVPTGDGYFATSAFWKRSYEHDRSTSLGLGDRPDYGKRSGGGYHGASPASYTPNISASKRNIIYHNLAMKHRYESNEEKYRYNSEAGPGPAKYDTRVPAGSSEPKIALKSRQLDTRLFKEALFLPGPDAYTTRNPPGYGLPKIVLTGRAKTYPGKNTPGPGQYTVQGGFDKYNLIPAGWSTAMKALDPPPTVTL